MSAGVHATRNARKTCQDDMPEQEETDEMSEPLDVRDTQIRKSTFANVSMSGSVIDDVSLSGCAFKNVNLGNCDIHDISFGNTITSSSCFMGAEAPHANTGGVRIAGVRVDDLLDAYKQVHGGAARDTAP